MTEEQDSAIQIEPTFYPSGLDYIRALDEEENWSVRNQVVTKEEHNAYIAYAKGILDELVENLPISKLAGPNTTSVDARTEQDEYMNQFGDADFQGSVSQFDVDYLESIESGGPQSDSNLTRESLYVKFDPLVGRPSPNTVYKQRAPRTPVAAAMGSNLLMLDTPPNVNNRISHDLSSDLSLSSGHTTGGKMSSALIEVESCDHSHDLSQLSDDTASQSAVSSTPQEVLKFSEYEVMQLLDAARKEAAEREQMEYAAEVAALQKELVDAQTEQNELILEVESCQENDSLLQYESSRLQQELEMWKSKVLIYEEDESKLIEEHESVKQEISKIEQQRDQAFNDCASLEGAYEDLYQRFLKLRASSMDMYKFHQDKEQSISTLENKNQQATGKFSSYDKECEESIDKANLSYESLKKELGSLVAIEKANSKKVELQMISLEREIQASEKEKRDLSQICEELLKELGGHQKN